MALWLLQVNKSDGRKSHERCWLSVVKQRGLKKSPLRDEGAGMKGGSGCIRIINCRSLGL